MFRLLVNNNRYLRFNQWIQGQKRMEKEKRVKDGRERKRTRGKRMKERGGYKRRERKGKG